MQRADVVIVGAGSAGCVLAARLSEDPTRSVLLLEAGPAADPVPAGIAGPDFHAALAEPGWTWPELMATASAGQPLRPYRRGRGVGGSSAVNALVGLIGPAADYDRWEHAHGCAGWGWTSLSSAASRVAVPVRAAPRAEWGPVSSALVDSAAPGAAAAPLTRDDSGRRVSVADAYLRPAAGRPNLTVRAGVTVERVLVDSGRCVGVGVGPGDRGEVIEAGEVILAAGAVHTPAILLRSGIDRPGIGEGLQDHAAAPLALQLRAPFEDVGREPALAIATVARFASGMPGSDPADLDLQLLPIDHVGPAAPGLGIISVALMRVASRGRVSLPAGAPVTAPTIDLNMLSSDEDVTRLVAGVRAARQALATDAFRSIVSAVYVDEHGTTLDALGDGDDEIAAWLPGRVGDYVHAACTCRMGPATDERSVVDTHLRVIGVDGLRVCDASVFPELPTVNTHLPTVLVAERLAELMSG